MATKKGSNPEDAENADIAAPTVEPEPEPAAAASTGADVPPTETSAPIEGRSSRRATTELKAIVQFHTGPEERWKEVTKVTSVSKTGAGFILSQPCPAGCLISMVMPMPPELRVYDIHEELYSVFGLVQYCHAAHVNDRTVHHLGVGFVGKEVPESYKEDPMQSYRISGSAPSGLWTITESKPFKPRGAGRFSIALEVTISLMQKENRPVNKEETVTRNISANGASVACTLETEIGNRVKFACKEFDFYSIAIVRDRKDGTNGPATIHLEFLESRFPVEKISPERRIDVD